MKVPTIIRVQPDGGTSWGGDIPLEPGVLKWFKLSLPHRDSLPVDVRNSPKLREAEEIREQLDLTAVQVTAKFLTQIWSHCLEASPLVALDHFSSIQVVMTIPATWPSDAQLRFKEAIHKSSIARCRIPLKITFLSEAEAAVLAMDKNVKGRLQVPHPLAPMVATALKRSCLFCRLPSSKAAPTPPSQSPLRLVTDLTADSNTGPRYHHSL